MLIRVGIKGELL